MGFGLGCVGAMELLIAGNGKLGVAGAKGVAGVEAVTIFGVPGNDSAAVPGVCRVSGGTPAAVATVAVAADDCNKVGVVAIPG